MLRGSPRYCKTLVRVLLGEDLGFIGRPVMPSDTRIISIHRPAVQNRQTEIEASQRARKRHSNLDTNMTHTEQAGLMDAAVVHQPCGD